MTDYTLDEIVEAGERARAHRRKLGLSPQLDPTRLGPLARFLLDPLRVKAVEVDGPTRRRAA